MLPVSGILGCLLAKIVHFNTFRRRKNLEKESGFSWINKNLIEISRNILGAYVHSNNSLNTAGFNTVGQIFSARNFQILIDWVRKNFSKLRFGRVEYGTIWSPSLRFHSGMVRNGSQKFSLNVNQLIMTILAASSIFLGKVLELLNFRPLQLYWSPIMVSSMSNSKFFVRWSKIFRIFGFRLMNPPFLAYSGEWFLKTSFIGHSSIINHNPIDFWAHRRDYKGSQIIPSSQIPLLRISKPDSIKKI